MGAGGSKAAAASSNGENEKSSHVEVQEKKQEETKPQPPPMVPYTQLYRYADKWDKIMVVLGCLCAIGHGVLQPLFAILFGEAISSFSGSNAGGLRADINNLALQLTYLGIAAFFTAFAQVTFFVISGHRQAQRIRAAYFRSLLCQEIGWYDQNLAGALSTRIAGDIPKIQEAISDKAASYLQFMSMFFAGFIIGFIKGWKLTLVILSVTPLMALGGVFFSKLLAAASGAGQGHYAKAGAVADEVLTLLRTVFAFGMQQKESQRYKTEISKAANEGVKTGRGQGLGMGFFFFLIFCVYALGMWYGSKLVRDENFNGGNVITVFFSVIIGAMAIGQAGPVLATFAEGRGAAVEIFKVIDRKSKIDAMSEEGIVPPSLNGEIKFEHVKFCYPTRTLDPVLRDLSVTFEAKKTTAIVGHSGCGKSTIISLLERFYDPVEGRILLDGKDIKSINVQWMRDHVGLVSQQPVLFPVSIRANIASGLPNITDEMIVNAARLANAHDFISNFPDGYDTVVGDQGAQLSGGQRQRIAIARALLKDPQILLLDEATSALDNESEAVVQEALERASIARTTIVIAHRLSTIVNADRILVMDGGVIVEEGRHEELLALKGRYYAMVEQQNLSTSAVVQRRSTASVDFSASASKKMVRKAEDKDEDEQGKKEDREVEELTKDKSMVWWVAKLSAPDWLYITIGVISAGLEGLVWPIFSVIFSQIMAILIEGGNSGETRIYVLAFVGVGVASFVVMFLKFNCLAMAGERLTLRLRMAAFSTILARPMSWFDAPNHTKAILGSRLANDASDVKGVLSGRLGLTIQLLATMFGGLGVALYFCWRVALVVLSTFPVVAIGGALQLKVMTGFSQSKAYEKSSHYAAQAVDNIRTVVALGRLRGFYDEYVQALKLPTRGIQRVAWVQGVCFGVTEFCMFAVWALAFWYGSTLVDKDQCTFADMMKALTGVLFGAMMSGQLQAMMPDVAKAQLAARRLYYLLAPQSLQSVGGSMTNGSFKGADGSLLGEIEFRDVRFTYPQRPEVEVLRGMSFKVSPGQTLALVGSSGCGKSTVTSLLERFYEPSSGAILIDGRPLVDYDLNFVRRHIALVNQEPQLFYTSVSENISYGFDTKVEQQRIENAARLANAHDFISGFEKGYDTLVGDKGIQLSGGQRQRIAIARALIRDNAIRILLLDEATSALDSQSERLVHEALERARQGRTTIMIAHRLSTVRSADRIAVIDAGRVLEQGSHSELMAARGAYYRLVTSQALQDADVGDLGSASTTARPSMVEPFAAAAPAPAPTAAVPTAPAPVTSPQGMSIRNTVEISEV